MRSFRLIVPLGLCIAALTAGVALTASIKRAEARSALPPHLLTPMTSSEVAVALHRVSLDPEALAAAGLSPAETTALVDNAWELMGANPEALRIAQDAHATAVATADNLERVVRSGLATPEQITQYAQAQEQLGDASADLQGALNAIFNAATADVTPPQLNLLSTIRTNRVWGKPIEFLTVPGAELERVALRNAVSNERISAELEEPPDPADQALLNQWRTNPTVALAIANLQANLVLIEQAWNQATNEPAGQG